MEDNRNNTPTILSEAKLTLLNFISTYEAMNKKKMNEHDQNILKMIGELANAIDYQSVSGSEINQTQRLRGVITSLTTIKSQPVTIKKVETIKGFFSSSTKEVEEQVILPVQTSISSLTDTLKELLAEAQTQENEKKRKRSDATVMETFQTEMKRFKEDMEKQTKEIAQQSYSTGYQTGQDDLKVQIVKRIQLCLTAPEAQEAMTALVLHGQIPTHAFTFQMQQSYQQPQSEAPSNNDRKFKSDTDEEQKLEKWAGNSKAYAIKELVKLYNDKDKPINNPEKILIKLLIFQLMLHKNDKTISAIIEDVKKLLLNMAISETLLPAKFPRIISTLAKLQTTVDAISTAPLSKEDCLAFSQLTSSDLYLPVDGTGSAVFLYHYHSLGGQSDVVPAKKVEADYINNFKKKIQPNNSSTINFGAATTATTASQQTEVQNAPFNP